MGRFRRLIVPVVMTVATVGLGVAVNVATSTIEVGSVTGQVTWLVTFVTAAAAIGIELATRRRVPSAARIESAEEQLAAALAAQWEAEVRGHGISGALIPIRWTVRDVLRIGGVAGGIGPEELASLFMSMRSRRLVITGDPGAGKTLTAALLLLALLERREAGDPVPVLFAASGWEPAEEPCQEWLVRRLQEDHPGLESLGGGTVRTLVAERRIIPIIDGLDEMPDGGRRAFGALAAAWGSDPLILTIRKRQFEELEDSGQGRYRLSGSVVELQPASPGDLVAYLQTAPAGEERGRPQPLIDALVHHPHGEVAKAMANPLLLSLAWEAYSTGDDLDFLTDPVRFPTPESIREHLLGNLARRWGSGRYGRDAERWLGFLATHMGPSSSSDLAWWRLPQALSRRAFTAAGALIAVALVALFVLVQLMLLTVVFSATALPLFAVLALFAGLGGGALLARAHRGPDPAGLRGAGDPGSSLRIALRRTAAVAVSGGLLLGALYGVLMNVFVGLGAGIKAGLTLAPVAGVVMAMSTPGFAYLLAVALLGARGRIPYRLMAFLRQAEADHLLVGVGGVYRFSHATIQEYLTGHGRLPRQDHRETPAGSRLGPIVREKVVEKALTLPEVLPQARALFTEDAVREHAERLLVERGDVIERAAADQYLRYGIAREQLVRAAKLPFWSGPAQLYRVLAWVAGAVAVWTLALRYLPEWSVQVTLGLAAGVWLVVSAVHILLKRRRTEENRPGFQAWGAGLLKKPACLLLVPALLCALFAPGLGESAGRWAGAPAVAWVAAGVWLVAAFAWPASAQHQQHRRVLAVDDPAGWLKLPSSLARYRTAAEQAFQDWIEALAREGVMPLIRAELGAEHDLMTTDLPNLDGGRLGGTIRSEEFVENDGSRRLELIISTLESASVGLSGPRGAGKSTTLRQFCSDDSPGVSPGLRLLVHAPTAYDPKEFIAHLFLEVCELITGESERRMRTPVWRRLNRVIPLLVSLAGAGLLIGTYQWSWVQELVGHAPKHLTVILRGSGVLLIVAGLAGNWLVSRRASGTSGTSAAEVAARSHLRSLRYLRAVTRTSTGEVSVPGGGKAGRQHAVMDTEQVYSYPNLVADLRELLELIGLERRSTGGKVIIGIDELDKIGTAEDAERFLNDLKVIFGVRGCYFLVALSEDALAGFERRSLAIRNTFDSAFDRIIRVPPMGAEESQTLLSRRGVPLPLPFVWLCHTLAGGLPRDLLRSVLDLTTLATEHGLHELGPLAKHLIQQDLRTVIAAQSRATAQEDEAAEAVIGWLAECAACPLDSAEMDALARRAPLAEAEGAARTIAAQTRAYLAILSALIKVFIEKPDDLLGWLRAHAGAVDQLAEARSLLAKDSLLAWHTTVRARAESPLLEMRPD